MVVKDTYLTINLTRFRKEVEESIKTFPGRAGDGSEILRGIPVIRGTRVPVYDVAASVASGIPIDRILSVYAHDQRA
jgi:uncharacterized protein (DUF433 family)